MKIIHLEEINSTNDYVKKHITELEDLTAVYADRQTSGRGRLTRKWVDSGDENLFLTIAAKPDDIMNFPAPNLTQYLSVILCMVLEDDYNLSPRIKWPNDVLVNNKKIAGILAEGTANGGNIIGIALGIGVNLNTSADKLAQIDKPATSIYNETKTRVNKEEFLNKLLSKFCLLYHDFVRDGFISIKDYYVSKAMFLGKEISINVLGNIHTGTAVRVTDAGALVLKEDNKDNTYYIGDIL